MLEFEHPVAKTGLTAELDPDFGCVFPEDADSFVVSVFLKKLNNKTRAVVLVPEGGDEALVHAVIDEFFSKRHRRIMTPLQKEELRSYFEKEIRFPVISFDPDSIGRNQWTFFWMYPPRELMH